MGLRILKSATERHAFYSARVDLILQNLMVQALLGGGVKMPNAFLLVKAIRLDS